MTGGVDGDRRARVFQRKDSPADSSNAGDQTTAGNVVGIQVVSSKGANFQKWRAVFRNRKGGVYFRDDREGAFERAQGFLMLLTSGRGVR